MDNSSGAVDREKFEAARYHREALEYYESIANLHTLMSSLYNSSSGKQEPELFTEADYD